MCAYVCVCARNVHTVCNFFNFAIGAFDCFVFACIVHKFCSRVHGNGRRTDEAGKRERNKKREIVARVLKE